MPTSSAVPEGAASRSGAGAREIVAVALIVGAGVLLFLPMGLLWAPLTWAVGAGLLWTSDAWRTRDKLLGSLVWPGGLIGPLLLLTSASQVCTQVAEGGSGAPTATGEPVCTGFALDPAVGIPLAVLLVGAPFVVGARLLSRAGSTDV